MLALLKIGNHYYDKEITLYTPWQEVKKLLQNRQPEKEAANALKALNNGGDKYQIVNQDIYLLFLLSIPNSKIANKIQKMDTSATIRNWNTINKLYILAKAMVDS